MNQLQNENPALNGGVFYTQYLKHQDMTGITFQIKEKPADQPLITRVKRAVAKNDSKLAKIPAQILYSIAKAEGEYVSKADICKEIWGDVDFFIRRSFDVHLQYLKKFLRDSGVPYQLHLKQKYIKIEKI